MGTRIMFVTDFNISIDTDSVNADDICHAAISSSVQCSRTLSQQELPISLQ